MERLIPWNPEEKTSSSEEGGGTSFDIVNDYPDSYDGGLPDSPHTFNIDAGYPYSTPVFYLNSQL